MERLENMLRGCQSANAMHLEGILRGLKIFQYQVFLLSLMVHTVLNITTIVQFCLLLKFDI